MQRVSNSAFVVFFKKLPQLLLAGLIYSAGLSACLAVSISAAWLSGFYNMIIGGLGLIPATLLLPGLVMVVRKYGVEKQFVPVVPTFFKAVRENLKAFILHGFVLYLVVTCSVFAVLYYSSGALASPIYSMVLMIYVLFSCVLFIALFYLPLMSVTYHLRLRDLYKNAIMLVFGTILRNIAALAYAALLFGTAFLAFLSARGVLRWITLGIIALFLPLMLCYGVTAIISKGMQSSVGPFVGVTPVKKGEITEEDIEAAVEVNTEDDYVFVNGKMIRNPNKTNQ